MRRFAPLLVALSLALPGAAAARGGDGADAGTQPAVILPETAIFYYPWFGTPARDGDYSHWRQNGATPPAQVASSYYPARGPYSSADALVVAAQMHEIAAAGVNTVIVSWWGRGSVEDSRLPHVKAAAAAAGLAVAIHLEPYGGRTVASVESDIAYLRGFGISDYYVWASPGLPDPEWARLNRRLEGVRLFANTNLAGKAAAGGFAGVYTYDVLLFDGRLFPRLCRQARELKLLCAPSVGPGYDARRATGDVRVRGRGDGATYDAMWRGAIHARADVVTITSYNEWHEGTQIEPARARVEGYLCYDGAWGLKGRPAETAYLDRTAYWSSRMRTIRALGG